LYVFIILILCGGALNAENSIISNNKIVNFSDYDKEKINTFLSNFSECFFRHFDISTAVDGDFITFAVLHNYKNNSKLFVKGDKDYSVKISKDYIEKTIEKYFNKKFTNHCSVKRDEIEYLNGYYQIVVGVGEVIPFVQVTKIIDKGNQELFVYGDEYVNANYFLGNPYKPIDKWSAEERKEVEKSGKMEAIVKKTSDGNTWRYILLKYDFYR
jgi:hypothetical protein